MRFSLRKRLVVLWLSVLLICLGLTGLLLYLVTHGLKTQLARTGAQVEQAGASLEARLAELLATFAQTAPDLADETLREQLTSLLSDELKRFDGIEGGLWSPPHGFVAYAFPTYPGTAIKRDVPEAEQPLIIELNERTLRTGFRSTIRHEGPQRILVLHAVPVPAPRAPLVVWTMGWVNGRAGAMGGDLWLGFAALTLLAIGSGLWLLGVVQQWSRQIRQLEDTLTTYPLDQLPSIAPVGDPDFDRIVAAFNQLRTRAREDREKTRAMSHELARSERLSVLGRMASSLAHEIRNPLASMRLKAENALQEKPERMPAALEAVLAQVARLDELLHRLLALARLAEVKPEPVQIDAWLAACLAPYREQAAAGAVQLTGEAPAAEFPVDSGNLERALGNLVLNALQHTPAEGRVQVQARVDGAGLFLAVADTGPGVPAAEVERIFDPFVSMRPNGTGLGLTLVREIVRAHGGEVRCLASQPGGRFEIHLPWPPS